MLILISVKNAQIMNNVESEDIIKASCFLLFIQRSLIHFLCFDMLVLISIETIKTMKSITNLSECIVIKHIDVMKFSCTSICMRKQLLLRNSILRFWSIWRCIIYNYQSRYHQVILVEADHFCASIMHDWMHKVAFAVLTRFNERVVQ